MYLHIIIIFIYLYNFKSENKFSAQDKKGFLCCFVFSITLVDHFPVLIIFGNKPLP